MADFGLLRLPGGVLETKAAKMPKSYVGWGHYKELGNGRSGIMRNRSVEPYLFDRVWALVIVWDNKLHD